MTWMWDALQAGLEPQPWHDNITWAWAQLNFLNSTPDLHIRNRNSVRVHPYAHPQHIKVLKHCVYIWHGCWMQSVGVWSLNHDITASLGGLGLSSIFLKSTPALHRRNSNSVRVHPYAHPKHIKVLKHCVYIWHGCGMLSKRVWSLNHDFTTSLGGLGLSSIFLKSTPALHKRNSVRVHPYVHPQHINVLKHFVHTWHGCGMHSKRVWSLNHDITTSLRLRPTPFFLNSTPDLHRHNSVRVHQMPIHGISRCWNSWGYKPTWSASHIHVICIHSVSAPWY